LVQRGRSRDVRVRRRVILFKAETQEQVGGEGGVRIGRCAGFAIAPIVLGLRLGLAAPSGSAQPTTRPDGQAARVLVSTTPQAIPAETRGTATPLIHDMPSTHGGTTHGKRTTPHDHCRACISLGRPPLSPWLDFLLLVLYLSRQTHHPEGDRIHPTVGKVALHERGDVRGRPDQVMGSGTACRHRSEDRQRCLLRGD
jgi:hypothetical protein